MVRYNYIILNPFEWSDQEWFYNDFAVSLTSNYIYNIISNFKAVKFKVYNGFVIFHPSTRLKYKYQVTYFINGKPSSHINCNNLNEATSNIIEYIGDGQPIIIKLKGDLK